MSLLHNHFFILTLGFGIITLIAGYIQHKYPPKNINMLIGYRTKASMKTQERWEFAQKYSAGQMMKIGGVNLVIDLVAVFLNVQPWLSMTLGLGVILLSTIVLIYKVERKLKRRF